MNPDQHIKKTIVHASPDLQNMVRAIKPAATWAQLKPTQSGLAGLRKVCNDFKRGKGQVCLFAGTAGAGKLMAAEAIANQLRVGLLRIDLSAVVSKYIGETEKNLDRLFDAAETQGAILFFDEADALFGKRSDVADSHDRDANIEVAYLLQRMQAHSGLCILASNHKHAVDDAFLRRFHHVVDFPA